VRKGHEAENVSMEDDPATGPPLLSPDEVFPQDMAMRPRPKPARMLLIIPPFRHRNMIES
jgi:hypothetical protein